jgi:hypothetical protein
VAFLPAAALRFRPRWTISSFQPDYRNLIGANREGETGVVVNLDVGREIASAAACRACRIWAPASPGCATGVG